MADPNLNKKVRKSNFSPEEVDALVNTVKKHYGVLYGEFSKRASNKNARHRCWLDVLRHVNQVSIEKRTLQEVKNKWKKCQPFYKYRDRPLQDLSDSMPLQQRLNTTPELQDQFLQSQPLSPTKLKVTRQAPKPPQPSPKPPTPEPPNEEVCLRWNSHHSNMQTSFPNLLQKEQYVDVTLVAEGKTMKCHRLILSSCSPYFEEVLSGISPYQHPVLFMKDIPFWILKSLCDFMYAGEVHIFQNKLEELLLVAEALKIKGLAGKSNENEDSKTEVPKDEKKEEKRKTSESPKPVTKPPTKAPASYVPKSFEKDSKGSDSDDLLDPLDLLEPVYEEVAKETKPTSSTPKNKDPKHSAVMKKGITRKLKKRKFDDDHEDSPPPVFHSRKGTRSRPNVKIPKFYHSDYNSTLKKIEPTESTIEHGPHAPMDDPLEYGAIKAEPLDLDDSVIEIEDNNVDFSEDEPLIHHTEEEEGSIISSYEGPMVNVTETKEDGDFKKIQLLSQPVIMAVHSVVQKGEDGLQIIDISQDDNKLSVSIEKVTSEGLEIEKALEGSKTVEDPLDTGLEILDSGNNKVVLDPLALVAVEESDSCGSPHIAIANVESVENETGLRIESVSTANIEENEDFHKENEDLAKENENDLNEINEEGAEDASVVEENQLKITENKIEENPNEDLSAGKEENLYENKGLIEENHTEASGETPLNQILEISSKSEEIFNNTEESPLVNDTSQTDSPPEESKLSQVISSEESVIPQDL